MTTKVGVKLIKVLFGSSFLFSFIYFLKLKNFKQLKAKVKHKLHFTFSYLSFLF